MKIASNLANHSRAVARPGLIARGRIGANHSRAVAGRGASPNHSRAVA